MHCIPFRCCEHTEKPQKVCNAYPTFPTQKSEKYMRIVNTIFGLLIGIAFATGGVVIAMQTAIPTYQSWHSMQSWRSGIATLGSLSGSDNNTAANYRYSVNGIDYQNDRVYVSPVNDNIGSYHQDLYRHLQSLKSNNQPVTIWYNPADPAQSVIDRDMRWGLFALMSGFCAIFILAGLGICYGALRSASTASPPRRPSMTELRRQWRQKQPVSDNSESFFAFLQQQAEHSRQPPAMKEKPAYSATNRSPWLERKQWRDNRIRSGAKASLYAIWAFAVLWNAISSPILFAFEDELKRGNYAVLIGALFPIVGLILLIIAWKKTRAWQRFGIIELRMDPFPGSIGGHVGGSLLLKNVSDLHTPYKIVLECVYSYVSGSGKNRSRRENVKWAEQGVAAANASGRGVRLEFRFDVPENLPEADIAQRGDYYFWRLGVSAELAGINLDRQYNIPVFNTGTQSRAIRHDISAQAAEIHHNQTIASQEAVNRGDFATTPLAKAFEYTRRNNSHIFYYPMFRNKLLTLLALIFAGGFDFAAYSINSSFGDGNIMNIIMLVFSLPFAVVGLIATIAVIYMPLNNLRVTLANRNITVLRRLFIFPIQYHTIAAPDIQNITIKSTGSTGQGVKQIKHYNLIAHGRNGKKVNIAEGIDGEVPAGQLRDFIGRQLGITNLLQQIDQ